MPLEMAITPRLVAYCHFHWYPQSLDATILSVYIIYIERNPEAAVMAVLYDSLP
ncbi:MAG: hypothetical protein V7606_2323 [Burkholderiales bacterium]|jgi:hypothetical protein